MDAEFSLLMENACEAGTGILDDLPDTTSEQSADTEEGMEWSPPSSPSAPADGDARPTTANSVFDRLHPPRDTGARPKVRPPVVQQADEAMDTAAHEKEKPGEADQGQEGLRQRGRRRRSQEARKRQRRAARERKAQERKQKSSTIIEEASEEGEKRELPSSPKANAAATVSVAADAAAARNGGSRRSKNRKPSAKSDSWLAKTVRRHVEKSIKDRLGPSPIAAESSSWTSPLNNGRRVGVASDAPPISLWGERPASGGSPEQVVRVPPVLPTAEGPRRPPRPLEEADDMQQEEEERFPWKVLYEKQEAERELRRERKRLKRQRYRATRKFRRSLHVAYPFNVGDSSDDEQYAHGPHGAWMETFTGDEGVGESCSDIQAALWRAADAKKKGYVVAAPGPESWGWESDNNEVGANAGWGVVHTDAEDDGVDEGDEA
jgi:hypothetical protein